MKKTVIFLLTFPLFGSVFFEKHMLYDHLGNFPKDYVANSPERLGNRVYFAKVKGLNEWFCTITKSDGEFTSPLETLLPGSIIPGNLIGSYNAKKKYLLKDDGSFEESRFSEKYIYLVHGDVPTKRTVYFREKR